MNLLCIHSTQPMAQLPVSDWQPVKADDHLQAATAAAGMFIHQQGGKDHIKPVTRLFVYVTSADGPKWPNGAPMSCMSYELILDPRVL